MPRGTNCIITVPGTGLGTGERHVVCTGISHGVHFEAVESEARNKRVLYPTRQSSGSFGLTIKWSKHHEYQEFNRWLVDYARSVSAASVPVGMRVRVPSRRFDKTGVLQSGVTFGDRYDDITWSNALSFVGVEDAVAFDSPLLSQFRRATYQDEISQFFYPAGVQQSDSIDQMTEAARLRRIETEQESLPLIPVRGPF